MVPCGLAFRPVQFPTLLPSGFILPLSSLRFGFFPLVHCWRHPWCVLGPLASLPGLFLVEICHSPSLRNSQAALSPPGLLSSNWPALESAFAFSSLPMSPCGLAFRPVQFPTLLPSGFILPLCSLRFGLFPFSSLLVPSVVCSRPFGFLAGPLLG